MALVLISNAPFGGGDKYLSIYRDKARNERNPLALAAALSALGRHGWVPLGVGAIYECIFNINTDAGLQHAISE